MSRNGAATFLSGDETAKENNWEETKVMPDDAESKSPRGEVPQVVKPTFSVEDRVELVYTSDQYTQLQPGTRGTIALIDDLGTIHVNWDDGSRLGIIPGEDVIRKVPPDRPGGRSRQLGNPRDAIANDPEDPRRGPLCGCGLYGDHDETHERHTEKDDG